CIRPQPYHLDKIPALHAISSLYLVPMRWTVSDLE
ncbi:unnamed protein product, partial [marine sediment metagenome]